MDWIEFFEFSICNNTPIGDTSASPCINCAVISDFYDEIVVGLKMIKHVKPDLYKKVITTWFCHNNPNKVCKGLLVSLGENLEDLL